MTTPSRPVLGILVASAVLSGCGGGGGKESGPVEPSETTSTRTAFDPCALLTDEELATAAGEELAYSTGGSALHDTWSCGHADATASQATSVIFHEAGPAGYWARVLPERMSPSRDDTETFGAYERAVAETVEDVDSLADLDDAMACKLWNRFMEELGQPVEDGTAGWTATPEENGPAASGEPVGSASVESCVEGVYSRVVVESPDAATDAVLRRVEEAHRLVRERARDSLPPADVDL